MEATSMNATEEKAEAYFRDEIESKVSGKPPLHFLLIDSNTGDYEVDGDIIPAWQRLIARMPQAKIWIRRVGNPVAHTMGYHARIAQ